MKTVARFSLVFLCLIPCAVSAQVVLGGQSAVEYFKSAPTQSGRVLDEGRPTFGYHGYLFVDGYLNDHVAALTNLKLSDNGYPVIDYFAIKLSDLTALGINLEVGKFDLPFGNLGERRFPRNNPLFSLPLIYEYRTALPDHVPGEADILSNRGHGSGMPLLDGGMYDLGAMIFGSVGILDYAAALSNGTTGGTKSPRNSKPRPGRGTGSGSPDDRNPAR